MVKKCILFDLDDTLYDYKMSHVPAQIELVKFLSTQLSFSEKRVSAGLEDSRKQIKVRLGHTASSHSRMAYIAEFLRPLNCQSHVELCLAAESQYWSTFLLNMRLYDGVEDFLLASRQMGFTNVLVTDLTASIQRRKLRILKVDALFDIVLTSEEAGGDKVTGLPEKYLRTLLGSIQGFSIGDSESDHLFQNETIFFRKCERGPILKTISGQKFSSFRQLEQEILVKPNSTGQKLGGY